MAPQPNEVISDPACGTCGFLVAAGEHLREHHPKLFHNKAQREHFQTKMFHAADFDASMLRIGAMNMTLHGVEHPDIQRIDSLSQDALDFKSQISNIKSQWRDRFTLILANTSSVDITKDKAKDDRRIVYSTYSTLMNRIDDERIDGVKRFGVPRAAHSA